MVRECKWDFMFTNHHISRVKVKQTALLDAFSYFSINLSFLLCCNCFVRKCFHPLHWLQALKNCKVFSSRTAATDRKWVSSGCIHAVSWLAAGKIWGHYSSGCSIYFPELFLSSVHNFCFRFKNTEKYVSF